MKNIATLAITFFFCLPALLNAQSLVLQSSNPADGSTSVQLVTNVSFTFNKALDTEAMLFEYEEVFDPEPYDFVTISGEPTFSNNDRTITLPVIHFEEGDYLWFVTGARAADGSDQTVPYLVRYTTLDQNGPWQVSGNLTFEDDDNGGLPASGISQLGRDVVYSPGTIQRLATPSKAQREKVIDMVRTYVAETTGTTDKQSINPEMIFNNDEMSAVAVLFDGNPFAFDDEDDEETEPVVRAAAIANPDGSYSIPYVRDGVYYPFAIAFEEDGFEAAFGFYDPDGTGVPATITVAGSNVSGIDMVLGSLGPITASEALETLTTTYAPLIEGQELISIITFTSSFGSTVEATGKSIFWAFVYHDRSEDIAMVYTLFPFGSVEIDDDAEGWFMDIAGEDENFPDQIDYSQMGTITAFADSDMITAVIEQNGGAAFREMIEQGAISFISYSAANFYWVDLEDDLASDRFLWKLQYGASDFTGFSSSAIFYADMQTGEFITGTFTSIAENSDVPATVELKQNYPNPFNPATVIPFRLDTDSDVRLAIYNMLGQEIATITEGRLAAGEHRVTWDAGNLSSGIYLYRLNVDGQTLTRKMVLVK
ncbi:MAG: T9SS C-terminal target domain-containing protein [Balneolaceae bacterium]|nr:MAG: T9SS C-terminal target domain-containing protein [Balneolaceae bacterium]